MRGRLLVDLGVELKNGAGGELAKAVTPLHPNVRKPDLGVPRYAGIQRFWTLSANRKLPLVCKRNLPKDRSHPISAVSSDKSNVAPS